jgi:hypothetical protein
MGEYMVQPRRKSFLHKQFPRSEEVFLFRKPYHFANPMASRPESGETIRFHPVASRGGNRSGVFRFNLWNAIPKVNRFLTACMKKANIFSAGRVSVLDLISTESAFQNMGGHL